MKEVYFYGSLRKGHYNYNFFANTASGQNNFIYNGTERIKGFKMYSLGAYPAVTISEDSEITVDHFTISEEIYGSIKRMELGAGYDEIIVDSKIMYIMNIEDPSNLIEVESGDWSEFKKIN